MVFLSEFLKFKQFTLFQILCKKSYAELFQICKININKTVNSTVVLKTSVTELSI